MKRTKRFLALLLSVLLLVGSVPLAAMADSGSQIISDVNVVLVTAPEVGEKAVYNWTVPAGIAYSKFFNAEDYSCAWVKTSVHPESYADLGAGEWYYQGQSMTFEDGYYYTFVAFMQNKDGYTFDLSMTGKVNGLAAKVERQGDKIANVWYPFYAGDLAVSSVDIQKVQDPVAGEAMRYDYVFANGAEGYVPFKSSQGLSSYWMATDKMPASWDDIDNADFFTSGYPTTHNTFEGGKYYTFVARVAEESGYTLSDASATINGDVANIRFLGSYYEVGRTFYVEKVETPVIDDPVIDHPSVSDKKTAVAIYINKLNYSVNGAGKMSDSAPVIVNSRTFVPFRFVAEALGGDVKWIAADQRIVTILDDTTVNMRIGSQGYHIYTTGKGEADGVMDVAPYINKANRTMVPLRFLAESLGCTVTPYYAADGTTERVVFEK